MAGGTLANANGSTTPLLIGNGSFSGVTLDQDVMVSSELGISDGLTIENGHVLTVGNNTSNGELSFTGSQTVSGNGQLIFGGTTSSSDYLLSNGSGTTVTLAAGISTLIEQNTFFESNVENQTSIILSAGKTLNQTSPLTNDGIIDIGTGATFYTYNSNFTNPADGIIRGTGTFNTVAATSMALTSRVP